LTIDGASVALMHDTTCLQWEW